MLFSAVRKILMSITHLSSLIVPGNHELLTPLNQGDVGIHERRISKIEDASVVGDSGKHSLLKSCI